ASTRRVCSAIMRPSSVRTTQAETLLPARLMRGPPAALACSSRSRPSQRASRQIHARIGIAFLPRPPVRLGMDIGVVVEESQVENRHQAQYLGDTPCLSATPSRRVRRLRVENLADCSHVGGCEVLCQTHCDGPQLLHSVGVNATPRINKRSN